MLIRKAIMINGNRCRLGARTVRDSKAFGFVELNDGGCFRSLQVVLVKTSWTILTG